MSVTVSGLIEYKFENILIVDTTDSIDEDMYFVKYCWKSMSEGLTDSGTGSPSLLIMFS